MKPGLRTLFFFLLFAGSTVPVAAQNRLVDSLVQWLATHPERDTLRVMTTHRLSYRLSEIDPGRSWQYARETETLARQLDFDKGIALANINYAILETGEGNLRNSADYYMKAISISERIGFTRGLSIAYNNVGENYLRMKQYAQAAAYTLKARDLNRSIDEQRGQAVNYEQLGSIAFEQKQYQQAFRYWTEGQELAMKSDDPNLLSLYFINFGKYHIAKGQVGRAFEFLREAEKLAQARSEWLTLIQCRKAEALGYDKLNQNRSAIASLQRGIVLSRELGNKTEECELYNLVASQYEKLGNPDSGIIYLRMHKSLSDTILSDKNFAHLTFIQTQYETRLKDRENAELKEIQKAQNRKLSEKNLLLLASSVALMLAMLSFLLFYRSFRHKKRNLELEEQQKLSEYRQQLAELEVRALRSQMNPHFLFNSLNSIRNYIVQNEPQLASDYLASFAALMRKILDASQLSNISIEEEIEMLRLYLDLEKMRFSDRFSFSIECDPDLDRSNIHIPTMVIQPFIENAIWHGLLTREGGGGELKVYFSENRNNPDEVICEVTDNGIGRQASEQMKSHLKKHHSRGITITGERLQRLAKLPLEEPIEFVDLLHANGQAAGTKVILHLPVL